MYVGVNMYNIYV